ncbi:MAG: helix-turn-helix transcriptional regulator [Pseudomonadota bacterium]
MRGPGYRSAVEASVRVRASIIADSAALRVCGLWVSSAKYVSVVCPETCKTPLGSVQRSPPATPSAYPFVASKKGLAPAHENLWSGLRGAPTSRVDRLKKNPPCSRRVFGGHGLATVVAVSSQSGAAAHAFWVHSRVGGRLKAPGAACGYREGRCQRLHRSQVGCGPPPGCFPAAREIGISPTTLSKIEKGHIPDQTTLRKVCDWIGEDVAKFTAMGGLQIAFKKDQALEPATAQSLANLIMRAEEQFKKQVTETAGH